MVYEFEGVVKCVDLVIGVVLVLGVKVFKLVLNLFVVYMKLGVVLVDIVID